MLTLNPLDVQKLNIDERLWLSNNSDAADALIYGNFPSRHDSRFGNCECGSETANSGGHSDWCPKS